MFLNDKEIVFVYNNRIIRDNLENGACISNRQVREAGKHIYPAEWIDVTEKITP